MVRQLFEVGILQSGFWHQFAMTAHSPIGLNPQKYGVVKDTEEVGTFANNDIDFKDTTGIDHNQFSFGLKKSLYNFMHGICFDYPLQDWFDFKIPNTKIPEDFICNALSEAMDLTIKPHSKVVWIGGEPLVANFVKTKKGNSWEMTQLKFHDKKETFSVQMNKEHGLWLVEMLNKTAVSNLKLMTLQEIKADFEFRFENFELFWFSKPMETLKDCGLLII
jgi:hypothetical protein